MAAVLIYLFPAIMDMVLSAVLFMCTVSAAQKGLAASTVANMITTWAVVYMICALLIGRWVTSRNCATLIIGSCLVTMLLSVAFSVTQDTRVLYALVALEGLAMALFFVPFQVFMKLVGQGRNTTINQSVGLYTFSWSLGYAAGPFAAGLMWEYIGWRGSHLVIAASAVVVGVMTFVLKHAAQPRTSTTASTNPRAGEVADTGAPDALNTRPPTRVAVDYSRMPDLAWMGWVFSGLGCLAARMIFGLFPSSAAECGLLKPQQGLTLFILSAVQACFGLWLGRFYWWMYRPGPVFAAGLLGVGSMLLFSTARAPWMFYLAAAGFGVYSGMFFFYLVFHSLVHPDRSSRYISVNEATVGLMSLTGPFVGGLIADTYELRTSYLATAGMLALAIIVQAVVHARYQRRESPSLLQVSAATK